MPFTRTHKAFDQFHLYQQRLLFPALVPMLYLALVPMLKLALVFLLHVALALMLYPALVFFRQKNRHLR